MSTKSESIAQVVVGLAGYVAVAVVAGACSGVWCSVAVLAMLVALAVLVGAMRA